MKKSGTKLFTFMLTAGMLAITSVVGANTNMTTKTETVTYKMEQNDEVLKLTSMTGKITNYKYLSNVESAMSKGNGYARVYLKGYNKPLLIEADKNYIDGLGDGKGHNIKACSHVYVYTEASSYRNVKCIGEIKGGTCGYIGVKNGLLIIQTDETIETLSITPDGEALYVKDLIRFNGDTGYSYGYNSLKDFHTVSGNEGKKLHEKLVKDYQSSETINFKIK